MKKLFIFDLDGTLLDTVRDLGKCCNHILQGEGYPTHPIDSYYAFVGNGIAKLIERALPAEKASAQEAARLLPSFRSYYDIHKADETRPYEGLSALLDKLQQRNALIAVASNKYQKATEELIERFFPQIAFAAVLGQRDGTPIKPHPAIVHDIMSITGITDTKDIMYIGDSLVDMNTAKNADVESVAVTWGFCPKEKLAEFGPDNIAHSAQELERILVGE